MSKEEREGFRERNERKKERGSKERASQGRKEDE